MTHRYHRSIRAACPRTSRTRAATRTEPLSAIEPAQERSSTELGLVLGQVDPGVQVEGAGPGQRLVDDQVEALPQVGLDRGLGRQAEPVDQPAQPLAGAVAAARSGPRRPPCSATSASSCGRCMLVQVVVGER